MKVDGRALAGIIAVLMFVVGCSSSSLDLDAEAARQLDVTNNAIADLTTAGSEEVPRDSLIQAVLRAQTAGTRLRVVVADGDGEFVPAKAIIDRYGGTALSYQANNVTFEAASTDMSGDQLRRAIDAAKGDLDIGESATAFVEVIESEGLDNGNVSLWRTLVLLFLVGAALFMLSGLYSYLRARKRRIKRQTDFTERKRVLRDWADQLGPQLESVTAAATAGNEAQQTTLLEAQDFVATIGPKVDDATSLGELDAAELRIGRVAIKLRDLQRSLDS